MKKSLKLIQLIVLLFISNQTFAQNPPVTNGLAGYWPFNGNTNDLSGTGNNATSYGATLTTDIDNYPDKAYSFEAGDHIQITNPIGYSQWTISAWISPVFPIPAETPYFDRMTIIGGDTNNELLGVSNDGLCLYTTTVLPYTFSSGSWYHVVFSYDGTNLTAYVNYSNKNAIAVENPFSDQIIRLIGLREAPGRTNLHPYNGKIDELIIYDRVLNDSEVRQLFYDTEQTKPSNNINEDDIANWNTAYGWGNHATAGYINENFLIDNNYLKFDEENHLPLIAGLKDTDGDLGSNGQILSSTGSTTDWIDAAPEGQWELNSQVLSLRNPDITTILHEKDISGGLTRFKIQNNIENSNYAGAVVELKGSGPEYTNNMYYGKYSDNFYISTWAGNGVMSTDQDLVLASVGSDDATNPNPNPRIIFQTGGKYDAPDFSITRMVLDENGNLGIGTTTPDQKLTVKGKIHTEEVLIDLNIPVPDYVFDDSYPIKSLEEVEAYIKENNHLSEIPSAVEIKENGLSVGEMNMLLLKKVEELTLYLIEQSKTLKSQQKEIQQLKDEIKQLKK